MDVTINGERRSFSGSPTLGEILEELGVPLAGIAVARNAAVVRRAAFAEEPIAEGDALEIIRAVPGG